MINALFLVPLYFYEIKEWDRKKKALLSRVNKSNFGYLHANTFQTDRGNEKNRYALDFEGIFREELDQFKEEAGLNYYRVSDIWTLKYTKKNENHCPHNHKSTGYTGLMYLEYDDKVHTPTRFIGPWNDPVSDRTLLASVPKPQVGMMYIWPSVLIHYAEAMQTNKLRMVTSWDMEVA
jgi:hypothetical protein